MKVLLLGDNHERCKNYEDLLNKLNVDYELKLEGDFSECTHLLIPGGIDVDPAYYGEEKDPTVNMIDRPFDELQMKAVDWFVKNKRPILGICRGHQLLNVYFGGSLIQDIKTGMKHTLPEYKNIYHGITNNEGFMKELYGENCKVNSTHHQAIKKLGEGLKPISFAEDGIIEACVHETLPVIMVQFHPERMALGLVEEETADGTPIFDYFFNMK